jgi:protein SCO1
VSGSVRLVLGVALAVVLAAGVALLLVRGEAGAPQGLKAGALDPAHAAPEFALRGSDGSEVTLARYRGKVVLLTFGFTYCAAVCPTTLATLAQARSELGAKADEVPVVIVTVDPARDDPAHMRKYLAAFDRSFVGATGDPEALAAVREDYGVTAERQGEGPDYAMAHTSSIFLIDRAGQLRAVMPFGHDAADFVHDIARL